MRHYIVDIPWCRQLLACDHQNMIGRLIDKSTYYRIRMSLDGQVDQRIELPKSTLFASTPQDVTGSQSVVSEVHWQFAKDRIIGMRLNGDVESEIELADLPLSLPANEKYEIGEMLATTEALYLSINHSSSNIKHQPVRHDLTATVAKLSLNGDLIWSAKFPTELIFSSLIFSSQSTEVNPQKKLKVKKMSPWLPTSWRPFGHDCLVLSGDRLLAKFAESSSGISRHYLLDASSGERLSRTDWSAGGFISQANLNEFLVGAQGYGQFHTDLLTADGSCADHWDSHGYSFLHEAKYFSIQMANTCSQPQRCVEMVPGGKIAFVSDPLGGYYTTRPQRLADGHLYFWRNNRVWKWDLDGGVEPIIETDFGDSAFGHSTQLSDQRVAFSIRTRKKPGESKLLIVDI